MTTSTNNVRMHNASDAHLFTKAKNGPTTHLMVANCSPSLGASVEDVAHVFKMYGNVHMTLAGHDKSHVFVSFDNVAAATKALEDWDGQPCPWAATRKLIVRYADKKAPKIEPPETTPAELTCKDCGVPGVELILNFVTEEQETALLKCADSNEWEHLARRRVQHWGNRFRYDIRGVDVDTPAKPFPIQIASIAEHIQSLPSVPSRLDQLTINEYTRGVGLTSHVDTHSAFEGAIVSLSLAGSAVMQFKQGPVMRSLLLPRRSLLILGGQARYGWQHSIPHRKQDKIVGEPPSMVARSERRVSFTFRKVALPGKKCSCSWPDQCDSQGGGAPPTRISAKADRNNLDVLEGEHVTTVYNAIAPHFSATRFAIWPKVKEFVDSFPPGSLVADVGCGNGKYFGVRKDIFVVGSDRAFNLAGVASQRLLPPINGGCCMNGDVFVADAVRLPVRPGVFDGVILIAVLHHISTRDRRRQLLKELLRLLKGGGRAMVTVWAFEQSEPAKLNKWRSVAGSTGDSHDYFVPWHVPLHRAEAASTASRGVIDQHKGTVTFQRYYHLFCKGELEELVREVPGCKVIASVYDKDNWVVEFTASL